MNARNHLSASLRAVVALALNLILSGHVLAVDCNENGIEDACDIVCGPAGGACDVAGCGASQDCNGNGVPDECESRNDCNANGVPDDCELGPVFSIESGHLSPIGADSPQLFVVSQPPEAGGPVTLTLTARADLGTNSPPCQSEYLYVYFNQLYVSVFFWMDGHECPATPDVGQVTISASTFNAAMNNGDLEILVLGNGNVDAHQCGPEPSFVAVRLEYHRLGDCNGNDVLDVCDIRDQTSPDVNGNSIPDECDADCNSNGVPDDFDLTQGTSQDCNSNGIPDECDPDADQDGITDLCDNCPFLFNHEQADGDGDGIGDVCDNCPLTANSDQCDLNQDGVGDACAPEPLLTTALWFDGNGDFAMIPDAEPLHFGAGDFTVELWFRTTSDGFLFDKRADVAPGEVGCYMTMAATGEVAFCVEVPELTHNEIAVISTSIVNDDQWHHVAGVREGNEIRIYVDGLLEGTQPLLFQMDLTSIAPVVLGSRHTLAGYLRGTLDEIRFWSAARTVEQITGAMYDHVRSKQVGLVGYWPLRGTCSDQVILDDSMTASHGWLGSIPDLVDFSDPQWVFSTAPISTPLDADGDVTADFLDNCPDSPNTDQSDGDTDGVGDICDSCPGISNTAQSDIDGDGIGDVCDDDQDGDGLSNQEDNCDTAANAAQEDTDGDGVGDACDQCPGTVLGSPVEPTGCPALIPGDFDRDGDVDQSDFGRLQDCASGSSVPQTKPECLGIQMDSDSDVDHADFVLLVGCLSGPHVPADPNCAD